MAKKKQAKGKQARRSPSGRKVSPRVTASRSNNYSVESLGKNVHRVQNLIHRFEQEVGSLVAKIVEKSEKSRRELSSAFEDMIVRLGSKDLSGFASDTRDGLQKQVKRLAEDILQTVKDVELLSERVNLGSIAHEMKLGLANLVEQLGHSGLLQKAKRSVSDTKQEVFQLLNIPTQNEVLKLERKIVTLEKKLSSITRRAA